MLLTKATVTNYRSIDASGEVEIDPQVTVLVGQNEAGKSAFLEALHKSYSIDKDVKYDVTEDYPRKGLTKYERQQNENPATVAVLEYKLTQTEINAINQDLELELISELTFTWSHRYGEGTTVNFSLPDDAYIQHIVSKSSLTAEVKNEAEKTTTIRALLAMLEQADLNSEDASFLTALKNRFSEPAPNWGSLLSYHVWIKHLKPNVPKFCYFSDYNLLPGKVNLPQLLAAVKATKPLDEEDKTVLSLLRVAGVDLDSFANTAGYEKIKARLEGFSNEVSENVFEYWKQNDSLDVQIDIRSDPADKLPFNSGDNLYIRISNRRHKVTVPFSQRSKGFIWFFSFLVWFSSIKEQLGTSADLILLLDELGLNLHALGQADLLRYVDHLAQSHQLIYTTHSPFMVRSDRLHQARTVEDKPKEGTVVSAKLSSSDPNTLFPLQAALGYTLAQNLFISKRNLLVEGPADLIYLKFFSALLDMEGRNRLRDDVTVVPVGGLGNVATFVALLGGNNLEMAVLHDYASKPDSRIEAIVREKLIKDKQILNYAMFRAGKAKASETTAPLISSDVEDMLPVSMYLKLFASVYKKELAGAEVSEADLPPGERIVERLERYLKASFVQLRATGGYNHYLPANYLASNPIPVGEVDTETLDRFNHMFQSINLLFSED